MSNPLTTPPDRLISVHLSATRHVAVETWSANNGWAAPISRHVFPTPIPAQANVTFTFKLPDQTHTAIVAKQPVDWPGPYARRALTFLGNVTLFPKELPVPGGAGPRPLTNPPLSVTYALDPQNILTGNDPSNKFEEKLTVSTGANDPSAYQIAMLVPPGSGGTLAFTGINFGPFAMP